MVEEDPSCATYGEAYEVHCARTGREPDAPLNFFKRKCCGPNGLYPELKIRLEVRLASLPRLLYVLHYHNIKMPSSRQIIRTLSR